jgi:hypothetical protein
VQNPVVLESNRSKPSLRIGSIKGCRKQVQMVRERLKVAQSWQKSYADKRRRDLSFEIRDFIYLKVSPMRGTRRFRVKGKLAPRYIDRKGEVDYQLELPQQLPEVHDVFHISQLKKCLRVPEEQLPMEYLDLGGDLTYSERPIRILDTADWVTHNKVIRCAKYSGVITRKMKQHGSMKKNSEQITLNYSRCFLNLVGEIPLRG